MASRREMNRAKVYRREISERERWIRDRAVIDPGGRKDRLKVMTGGIEDRGGTENTE